MIMNHIIDIKCIKRLWGVEFLYFCAMFHKHMLDFLIFKGMCSKRRHG